MTFSPDNISETPDDMADAETKMRLALNAVGSQNSQRRSGGEFQARARHQFVRDGEVPVVVLNSRKDNAGAQTSSSQMSKLEAELYAERAAREKADRQSQQVTLRLQSMQTQLTHAKMAQAEIATSLQESREREESLLQDNRNLRVALERAQRDHAEEIKALREQRIKSFESRSDDDKLEIRRAAAATKARVKAVARSSETNADESEPVQWWIPGWKNEFKSRYASKSGD